MTKPLEKQAFLQSPVLTSGTRLRRSPGPSDYDPAGRLAFYWAREYHAELWVYDPETEEQEQWTSPPFVAMAGQRSLIDRLYTGCPAWRPDGGQVAVAGRTEGKTHSSIYLVDGPGQLEQLTTGPGQHRNPVWSPDGKRLAFVSYRDGKDDIWMVSVDDHTDRQLTWDRLDNFNPVWSPDGTRLAYVSQRSDEDPLCCQICVLDLGTGKVDVLTEGGRIHSRFPQWAPDGKSLYYLSDRSGWDEVWRVNLLTRAAEPLTPHTGQDKGQFALSPDGAYLAFSSVRHSNHDIEVLDLDTGETTRLNADDGVYLWPAWDRTSEHVAVRAEGPQSAPELVVYDAKAREAKTVTRCSRAAEHFVSVEEVSFESFDGLTIDGILYVDRTHDFGGQRPAILYVHGGPNGQHVNGWWPYLHYLASQGYVILALNSRGSTGYGRAFMDLNIKDWGGDDRQDWLGGVKLLRSLPFVDGERIGIWGRSYGGYATVRGLSKHPEVFKAGVCHFGPIDLAKFFTETSVRQLMIHFFGLPLYNEEDYRRCSPSEDLENITSPLLVLQGDIDDGVPKYQSEELVRRLRSIDRDVEYQCYPEEGHGFDLAEHVFDAAGRIAAFWNRSL